MYFTFNTKNIVSKRTELSYKNGFINYLVISVLSQFIYKCAHWWIVVI